MSKADALQSLSPFTLQPIDLALRKIVENGARALSEMLVQKNTSATALSSLSVLLR